MNPFIAHLSLFMVGTVAIGMFVTAFNVYVLGRIRVYEFIASTPGVNFIVESGKSALIALFAGVVFLVLTIIGRLVPARGPRAVKVPRIWAVVAGAVYWALLAIIYESSVLDDIVLVFFPLLFYVTTVYRDGPL